MRTHPITEARREAGLSLREAAFRARVSVEDLHRWEQGRGFPDSAQAVRLARHLRRSLAEILWTAIEAEAAAGRIPPLVNAHGLGLPALPKVRAA